MVIKTMVEGQPETLKETEFKIPEYIARQLSKKQIAELYAKFTKSVHDRACQFGAKVVIM